MPLGNFFGMFLGSVVTKIPLVFNLWQALTDSLKNCLPCFIAVPAVNIIAGGFRLRVFLSVLLSVFELFSKEKLVILVFFGQSLCFFANQLGKSPIIRSGEFVHPFKICFIGLRPSFFLNWLIFGAMIASIVCSRLRYISLEKILRSQFGNFAPGIVGGDSKLRNREGCMWIVTRGVFNLSRAILAPKHKAVAITKQSSFFCSFSMIL